PRPRHAHEPGGELAPAGMALVPGPERNRGERAAVGTARAEARHLRRRLLIPQDPPLDAHPDALVEAGRSRRVVGRHAESHALLAARAQLAEGMEKECRAKPLPPPGPPDPENRDPAELRVAGPFGATKRDSHELVFS